MLRILTRQASYPPVAIVLALMLSFIFNAVIPHGWASMPIAQSYVLIISKYVPAMSELTDLLPPGKEYIALTGAAIWGLMPIYLLIGLLIPYLDKSFLEDTRRYANQLNFGNKKIILSFFALFVIDGVFANFSFFTVWKPAHHYGPGSWMNILSSNAFAQLITWTFVGLAEFLFLWIAIGIFWIIRCKFQEILNFK